MKDTYYCSVCKKTLTANDGVFVHEDIVHSDDIVFDSEEQQPIALYTGNYTIGFLNSDKTLKVGEPLYTAQRELSDEEIRQIYIETMESPYTHQQSYFGFARALLKKASEK